VKRVHDHFSIGHPKCEGFRVGLKVYQR
jgi:hypothetical protein